MDIIKGKNVTIKDGCKIADHVILEDDVFIDYNCIIRENVTIKSGTYVGPNCILGEYTADFYKDRQADNKPLVIGRESIIRSGSIIYSDSEIGDFFQTGHRVTIREKSKIGHHVSVGTLSDIQGDCVLGNYVRLHSNVHVGMKSQIEDYVWIYPYVILTNDPTPPSEVLDGVIIKSHAVIATASVLLPGVVVESDSLVAAGAVVTRNVKTGEVVGGNPAKVISNVSKIKNRETNEPVYPWRYTFDRGMPWEGMGYEKWNKFNTDDLSD